MERYRAIMALLFFNSFFFFFLRTDDQKRERLEETIRESLKFLPGPIVMAMGEQNHQDGSMTILNLLQQPKLNKQVR